MPLEINYYDINIHKLMLYDGVRCDAFRRALAQTVTPDSAVLDIGAGTGLLSIFAAQAGARVVYAVERTRTTELAERIISDNDLTDRIKVFQDDMENVELPEQVDVIVSEWLGGYGVDENLLPVVVQARDKWLKPGGVLIPGTVSSWITPAYDDALEQDAQFWTGKPYGLNMSAIGERVRRQLHCCRNNVKEEHLLAYPQQMWEVDPASITLGRATDVFEAELSFTCRKAGRCNALAAWFEASLTDDIALSNKPSEMYTHWGRWVFPIGECIDLEEGSIITVYFMLQPGNIGQSTATWRISMSGYSFSSEDLTSLTR